mmetsp:Transcript_25654/g.59185  ORF Transcript_25654/g.59185 Transcript_25654/m.59185 type:complete len:278 (-) Transcript_25654:240-1073(-)
MNYPAIQHYTQYRFESTCGIHCVNNLLQLKASLNDNSDLNLPNRKPKAFTKKDFDKIAGELSLLENTLVPSKIPLGLRNPYRHSSPVLGNFSIHVLEVAIQRVLVANSGQKEVNLKCIQNLAAYTSKIDQFACDKKDNDDRKYDDSFIGFIVNAKAPPFILPKQFSYAKKVCERFERNWRHWYVIIPWYIGEGEKDKALKYWIVLDSLKRRPLVIPVTKINDEFAEPNAENHLEADNLRDMVSTKLNLTKYFKEKHVLSSDGFQIPFDMFHISVVDK